MQKWKYKQLKGGCTQTLPTGADSKYRSERRHKRQKSWEQGEQQRFLVWVGRMTMNLLRTRKQVYKRKTSLRRENKQVSHQIKPYNTKGHKTTMTRVKETCQVHVQLTKLWMGPRPEFSSPMLMSITVRLMTTPVHITWKEESDIHHFPPLPLKVLTRYTTCVYFHWCKK